MNGAVSMLKIHEHGVLAEIELHRPPVNAMNQELLEQLTRAHALLCADGAQAIVLSGREGLFSAGLDVPALLGQSRDQVIAFWASFFRLMSAVAASPVPVAAAITGHAPAGGAVLALHCDYRVATQGDFRIGLNEVQVGLPVPINILFMLEFVVGSRQAMLLASAGTLLSPDAALEKGFVDELVPPGKAVAAALAWCRAMVALPGQAMNITRLAAKSALIAKARDNESYAVTATDYWFSDETQVAMRKLAASLGKSAD
jgi:enoyl-CoA hydratase/carnithine racemase